MTIYIVKWLDTSIQKTGQSAHSSYAAASKKINELRLQPGVVIFDKDGDPVQKHQPKTQTDVIDIINNL